MASMASFSGTPTLGNVNSSPPFSFKSSSGVGKDYSSKPSVAALRNPTLHNNVPESMVNSTARVPIFVRPFQQGFEKHYSEGDILFVRRDDERASSSQKVVANLPVLNHMLRTEMKREGDRDVPRYQTIEDVIDHWNYFGILNNDMDTGSKWQRLLNVNVRGRSRVARLWSPDRGHLRKGDQVWISFLERRAQGVQSFQNPNGIREPLEEGRTFIEAVPTMDCCDDFDNALMSIPVGIVSQTTLKKPITTSQTKARYVTETCKLLERIEVLMRI